MKLKKLSFFFFAVITLVLLLAATSLYVSAEEVKYYVEGGRITFNTTTGTIVDCDESVTRADIPGTIQGIEVTMIGPLSFYDCSKLESVTIPNTVTEIGELAFQYCSSLKSIIIPASVKIVESYAFAYCSSLEKVAFMGEKVYWGRMAPIFEGCNAITTIVPPNMGLIYEDKHFPTSSPPLYTTLKYVYYRGSKAEFDEAFPNYRSYIEKNGGKIYYNYSCTGPFGHEYEVDRETKIACNEFAEDRCCIYCNEPQTREEYITHNWGEWNTTITPTCTRREEQIRSCMDCDLSEHRTVSSLGHEWSEWNVVTAPTDDAMGQEDRVCTVCGETDAKLVLSNGNTAYPVEGGYIYFDPETGTVYGSSSKVTRVDIPSHINDIVVTTIDDCAFVRNAYTLQGHWYYKGTTSLKYVSFPDTVTHIGYGAFAGCTSLKSIVIPESVTSIGTSLHATHDNEGYLYVFRGNSNIKVYYRGSKGRWSTIENSGMLSKSALNITYDYTCEAPYGHSFDTWEITLEPTCTEAGEEISFCSYCQTESSTRTVTPRHTWGNNVTVTAPTCTEEGIGVRACAKCDVTETITIPANGHEWGEWITTLEPGCATFGSRYHICSVCDSNVSEGISPTGDHAWSEWSEITAPTCTKNGEKSRECSVCATSETQTIPATGLHMWSEWMQSTTPTCVKDGEKTRSCPVCNTTETQAIPATGEHSWSAWGVSVAPTVNSEGKEVRLCTVCNTTESRTLIALCEHTYGDWTVVFEPNCTVPGEESRTCVDCGISESREIAATGEHVFGDWETVVHVRCEVDGKECRFCNYCDETITRIVEAPGHSFGEWTEISPAHCATEGTEALFCDNCDEMQTRVIPAPGHVWGEEEITVAPGCESSGTLVYYCAHCDEILEETLDATGHTFGEWSVTKEPNCTIPGTNSRKCTSCNKTENESIPATGEHLFGEWELITPARCDEDGKECKFCAYCDETLTQAIPASGHEWLDSWEVIVPAACATDGSEALFCVNCDEMQTRTIPAIGHSWGEWEIVVQETCGTEGTWRSVCSNCNASMTHIVDPLDHTFGEWIVTVDPTCEVPGEEQRSCVNCNATESREIEPIDHIEVHVEAKEPTCSVDGNIEYYYCSVCGYHRTPDGLPTNRFNVIVPSTGDHSFGEWTITIQPTVFDTGEQSRSCSICGETEVEELAKLDMTNPFTDVKEGKWYTEGVLYCYHKGYMAGVSEDTFGYKQNVTRAMFVTILAKIDGADTSSYTETSFSDVKAGQWYSASIEWAYKNGYAAGIGDKIFGYKENVSREQIAMFLYTYSEKNDISVTRRAALAGFDDYDRIHAYALDAVSWAVKVGLISGTSDTILAPRDPATRAEIALIINNYVENVMNTEIIEAGTDSEFTRDGTPKKYFTLSFDDGITQDARIIEILKKYDVDCCTFNINTGLYGVSWPAVGVSLGRPDITHIRYTEEELMTGIYDGYDVEVHTLHHPALGDYDSNPEYIINQVAGDAANIQKITGRTPIGMAWPGGDDFYTGTTIDIILKNTDIRFARGTTSTFGFKLPQYFMKWLPTCSVSDPLVLEYAKTFLRTPCTEDMLFYVWGHGYEFDFYHSYDTFEALIKMISEADDIVLVTNAEFYQLFKDEIPSWH